MENAQEEKGVIRVQHVIRFHIDNTLRDMENAKEENFKNSHNSVTDLIISRQKWLYENSIESWNQEDTIFIAQEYANSRLSTLEREKQELVEGLKLVIHATAPKETHPSRVDTGGAYHENAYQIATDLLLKHESK